MSAGKPEGGLTNPGRIGLALGTGAARGWAHVGVIRELEDRGLGPDVVCGSSSGALVGALYAGGRLDAFESWGRQLDWRQIVGYFDVTMRGGFIKARKLLDFLTAELECRTIGDLPMPFATVATDLASGREIWLREGPILECLQASMALPGLIAPVLHEGRWLVDGGLVNAVPVSLCRAMGADAVIAVDLNTRLLERRGLPLETAANRREDDSQKEQDGDVAAVEAGEIGDEVRGETMLPATTVEVDWRGPLREEDTASRVRAGFQELMQSLRERMAGTENDDQAQHSPEPSPPSIYEVVANSINIMQVRNTRSRMAGDPPELLVMPKLEDFNLLDFDRAEAAIEEGRRAVARALAAPGV